MNPSSSLNKLSSAAHDAAIALEEMARVARRRRTNKNR